MCIFAAAVPAAAAAATTATTAAAAGTAAAASLSAIQIASLAATAVGGLVSAYGAYQTAQGQKYQAQAEAKIARNNQKVADWQAEDAIKRGSEADIENRRRYAQMKGSQRAALASRGIDLGEGSALSMLQDTDMFETIDSQRIRDNARTEAWGFRNQGANFGAQAAIYRSAASGYNPLMSAGSSLLTSGGEVADRWLRYRGLY